MATPLGKAKVQRPNMSGSIQDIMLFMLCWRGSAPGPALVDIFWETYIVAPTSTGRMGVGSGWPRLSQRKFAWMGTDLSTRGIQP